MVLLLTSMANDNAVQFVHGQIECCSICPWQFRWRSTVENVFPNGKLCRIINILPCTMSIFATVGWHHGIAHWPDLAYRSTSYGETMPHPFVRRTTIPPTHGPTGERVTTSNVVVFVVNAKDEQKSQDLSPTNGLCSSFCRRLLLDIDSSFLFRNCVWHGPSWSALGQRHLEFHSTCSVPPFHFTQVSWTLPLGTMLLSQCLTCEKHLKTDPCRQILHARRSCNNSSLVGADDYLSIQMKRRRINAHETNDDLSW